MSDAYSNEQMLSAIVSAAISWKQRVEAAGRTEIVADPKTRTAVLVVDFDEIVALRDALESGKHTRLAAALHADLDDWLDASVPIEPPDGE